jgi:hypothetical protein
VLTLFAETMAPSALELLAGSGSLIK